MDLFQKLDDSLHYQAFHHEYFAFHQAHAWPRHQTWQNRPYFIIVCPHEGDYSLFTETDKNEARVQKDEIVIGRPFTNTRVIQHSPGLQSYSHIQYSLLGGIDPFSFFELPMALYGKDADHLRPYLLDMCQVFSRSSVALSDRFSSLGKKKCSVLNFMQELLRFCSLRNDAEQRLQGILRLEPVLRYIQENLHNSCSRAELAALLSVSQSRFTHIFQEIMGIPPKRYVQEQRQRKASELILSSSSSIKDIAETLGYCDQFEFSRRFKMFWGVSPRDYRNSLVLSSQGGLFV